MGKLSIRDEGVNDLAETLADMLGVNKTEAVRQAIQNEAVRRWGPRQQEKNHGR